jgi:hypothetical protein
MTTFVIPPPEIGLGESTAARIDRRRAIILAHRLGLPRPSGRRDANGHPMWQVWYRRLVAEHRIPRGFRVMYPQTIDDVLKDRTLRGKTMYQFAEMSLSQLKVARKRLAYTLKRSVMIRKPPLAQRLAECDAAIALAMVRGDGGGIGRPTERVEVAS